MPKANFDKHFSDVEKAQFQAFADNPHMVAAVKKAILAGVYEQGVIKSGAEHDPTQNFALSLVFDSAMPGNFKSNEAIGADLRACAEGVRMVETAFNNMLAYKSPDPKVASKNPAR